MSESADSVSTPVETRSTERLTGRVKWFNSKAGFGFITVSDGERAGTDIFVHHSAIIVESEQYKYLVQGEYVEFALISSNGEHQTQAGDVSGIKGGKLMCETRSEFRSARTSYVGSSSDETKQQQTKPSSGVSYSSKVAPRSTRPPVDSNDVTPVDSTQQASSRSSESRRQPKRTQQSSSESGNEWTYVGSSKQSSGRGGGRGSGRGRASGGTGRGRGGARGPSV
jgi:CspA family cold shock protein